MMNWAWLTPKTRHSKVDYLRENGWILRCVPTKEFAAGELYIFCGLNKQTEKKK